VGTLGSVSKYIYFAYVAGPDAKAAVVTQALLRPIEAAGVVRRWSLRLADLTDFIAER
jgi:hypothetical protein